MLSLSSRWSPAVILAPLAVLIFAIVGRRFASVDFLSELTVYRIGDAISLLSGESSNIHPVQGLPGAIIAKALVWLLMVYGQAPLITAGSMTFYIIAYFGFILSAVAAAILVSWHALTNVQRCAIAVLLLCPWLLGGPSLSLLTEPDYWITEWAYLAISFCLLALPCPPVLIGVWLAVGLGIKITLFGIAPLFLSALPNRRALALAALSFAVAYFLMALVYMGSISGTIDLLAFQGSFFVHPNASAQYADISSALSGKPFLVCLVLATGIAIATSPARPVERILALVWALGFGYLIWRRPHDTSISSAATAFLFMALYFVRRWPALAAVALLLLAGAVADNFDRLRILRSNLANAGKPIGVLSTPFDLTGMIFLPDNDWNAGLAVQAVGYNGGLGLYPIKVNPSGLLTYEYGGRAFHAIFPTAFIVGDDANLLAAGLEAGIPLWWTRPEPPDRPEMQRRINLVGNVVERAGLHIQTKTFTVNGNRWLFQRATK